MGTFEIDSKTIDLNLFINGVSPMHRVRRQVILIGIINDYSPRKLEMQKDSDGHSSTIEWTSATTAFIKKINGPIFMELRF